MSGPRATSTPGDLQILARLGVGGMGEVLLARRIGAGGFEKLVALKTIRGDLAEHEGMRRMFLDEAKLLARLDHPAIAQVYELRDRDGAFQLVMEYVPGLALGTLLKRKKGPVPPGVAALMAAEAARGLHAAHELTDLDGRALGVIHRDISPQNLILTFDGRIKVLDFGVAFVRDREATTTEAGVVKGKLAYLSPEQIQGKKIDRRADLYALSVVLHELLTGRRLFGRGESIADAVKRGRIAKPSSVNKEVPAELDALVMKGLARDPNDRYADAKEMALALEGCARGIGAETLEAYAQRELATERELHRTFLQRVVAQPEAPTERGKGSGTESLSPLDLVEVVSDFSQTPRPPANTGPWAFLLVLLLAGSAAVAAYLRPDWVERARSELELRLGTQTSTAVAILAPAPKVVEPPPPPPEVAPVTPTVAVALAMVLDTSTQADVADTVASEHEEDEEPDETPPIPTSTPTEVAPAPPPPPPPGPSPSPAPIAKQVRAAPKPQPKAPPPKARTTPKRPPRPGYGALSIAARPGGVIYVDGKRAGPTPLERYRIKVGRYTVTLKRPGDPRPRWRSTVNINEGKLVRITLR
ncbi:MAG: serine/threonine protein kinase [Deltaproteobacteria bacterium]|nr:serine/threonine protein kinase [Deltaproteobacteria bacterium]